MFGRGVLPTEPFGRWLADRIHRADQFRRRLLAGSFGETNAYRVVHGEGDGVPGLVIDRYADLAVVRLYSAAWAPWLDAVVAAIEGLDWAKTVFRRLGVARVDGAEGG